MPIEEMHAAVREFCAKRGWDEYHAPKELAIGMTNESSELLQEFRFKDRDEQLELLADPEAREEIEDELADVLFFVLRFADMYDVELDDALASKLDKNRKRFPANEYNDSEKNQDK
jgi:NTP pyrophosphatase (non-canonical NTP hydrolase)